MKKSTMISCLPFVIFNDVKPIRYKILAVLDVVPNAGFLNVQQYGFKLMSLHFVFFQNFILDLKHMHDVMQD